ncbi:MAG: class I SAM-dependent methyltransferase [Candidatus Omnitrophica bacterium]|nr:class I SAM-dependent methyltransferase [Candidatus Omnitrophota bacterium]
MKILDLGCGDAKEKGAVGIDYRPCQAVDIVHDLNIYPWPLENNFFDLVVCKHVIEHLNDVIKAMEEIHRILKKGGIVKIYTPHMSNIMSFRDPTHKWHFTCGSFDYFIEGLQKNQVSYTDISFKLVKKRLTFTNNIVGPLAKSISKLSMETYEKHFCRMFPAKELYLEMQAVK